MDNKKTASVIIRSAIFWIIMFIFAIFYNIIAFIIRIFPLSIRYKVIASWGVIFTAATKYICGVRYTIYGSNNILKKPVIIVSNHQSTWETIALSTIFPPYIPVLKHELLLVPLFGWCVATLSPIAIHRNKRSQAMQQILEQGAIKVKQNFSILLFPEGTRVANGVIKPFKTGAARIAVALNLPLCPVAHNAGDLMPKNNFCIYPGNINVIIGSPIYPSVGEDIKMLSAQIEYKIRSLLNTANAKNYNYF